MDKITTLVMEIALARFINPRVNLVVPNVSWGFFNHECDLISISKSGFATEYEIKVSKSDLKADKKKKQSVSVRMVLSIMIKRKDLKMAKM